MWFCCIKIISGCTFQSSRANFIWIPEDWWWCNIWVFSRSLQAPRTAWSWSIQSSPGCKPYLIQEKSLDVFYQKVFETSIDQLNFMNLVDGEIDSDLHKYFYSIYWVMFDATQPLSSFTNCKLWFFPTNLLSKQVFLSCKIP